MSKIDRLWRELLAAAADIDGVAIETPKGPRHGYTAVPAAEFDRMRVAASALLSYLRPATLDAPTPSP